MATLFYYILLILVTLLNTYSEKKDRYLHRLELDKM
jgi:hypothetical protein